VTCSPIMRDFRYGSCVTKRSRSKRLRFVTQDPNQTLQCLTVRIDFGLVHFDITQTCSTEPGFFCANNAADFDRAACAPASAHANTGGKKR